VSSRYWELLWKRARRFMITAERDLIEGDFDGACFNSEQALQLAVKATIYRVYGVKMRIHSTKTLLSQLRNMLYESGRLDLADVIGKMISDYRRELELLEESYIEGRYGEVELLESQGRSCVEVARRILEVLRRIEVELAETSS
jgi:HEPN domain-containing protein